MSLLQKSYFGGSSGSSIEVLHSGIEDCSPAHYWGPGVRDHYIIHYVIKGHGTFTCKNVEYEIKSGQGFLIPPNTIVSYHPSNEKPWTYAWVGFKGEEIEEILNSSRLNADCPVFSDDIYNSMHHIMLNIVNANSLSIKDRLLRTKYICDLFTKIMDLANISSSSESGSNKQDYVQQAVDFININYSQSVTVDNIANSVGLDRSYLYTLFKDQMGLSPKEYLTNLRIARAKDLLRNHSLAIGDVARSVGYEDPLLFSKTFKRMTGVSPTKYK